SPTPSETDLNRLIKAVRRHLGIEPKKTTKGTERTIVKEQPEPVKEKIQEPGEMPEDVEAVKSIARRVYKNEKGFWRADYGDGIVMIYIPPGEFTMGSNDYDREKPPHQVYLDGYWMGKTVVTVMQYMQFAKNTNSHYPEWLEKGNKYNIKTGSDDHYKKFGPALTGDNYPIVGVSWNDVIAYCKWLTEKTSLKFRLPTEAQWEKAARGPDGREYPWGKHPPYHEKKYYANYDKEDKFKYTSPVGSFPGGASPYGLLDMAGNVWEWCNDWYDSDYYKNSPDKNPQGPESGTYRVVRGGSWYRYAAEIRCAYRFYYAPSLRYFNFGFRLCQDNH
ncbi:MAG: SUMF1/EgtB/PvdO family nonheme iron enzyme, partial [Candidatus Aminicenantes bacterium]|nr:SUMF1/EgtB/PvdO family nonheme iron enzyme [Candidatus Aminicenantes bacterium]NIM80264.1 SUMF1/EgtB/PvdO family nonheme iron enzyme [Candidatus Aminicenantes bacterium]NIN16973.1 SUMF1/EgtB/PvdO family nonheme iron enzyme [Candidatus Aminicenantes bacterium]NIN40866.1 SUMF1/EgtB/PvdO family nonheme iron enzyme [Candidatus Aminicenantes bacterium]NIN83670.1 SUMF1/EgtB/PvdO family nonheme iron enzyme [Candidatus Aminicenantes bacterium]